MKANILSIFRCIFILITLNLIAMLPCNSQKQSLLHIGLIGEYYEENYFRIFNPEKQISQIKIKYKYDLQTKSSLKGLMFFTQGKLIAGQEVSVFRSDYGDEFIFSDVVVTDFNGAVLERLTNNRINSSPTNYCYSHPFAVSPSNSKILFSTNSRKIPPQGQSWTKEQLRESFGGGGKFVYSLMDYNTKNILFTTERFGKSTSTEVGDQPWSPDEKNILYTVTEPIKTNLSLMGKKIHQNQLDSSQVGLYIFNFEKGKDIKFFPKVKEAEWNPSNNTIVYLLNSDIYVYDFDTDTHKLFLKSAVDAGFHIGHVRWTPDGEYLFVQCVYKKKKDEKLYNVKDGKEVNFKKLNIGHPYFTWR